MYSAIYNLSHFFSIIGLKSGSCPKHPSDIPLFPSVAQQCDNDWMCLVGDKCCSYQQGKTQCESANYKHHKGMIATP